MSTFASLISFHAVSQTLNISQAARDIGVTQPAVTRHLQRLEEALGVKLFVRRQRGIALTDAGAKLAESIGPVLTTLDERLELIKSQSTSTRGKIRIGALSEIGKHWIMPRLLAFTREFPDVEADLRLMTGFEIIKELKSAHLDFGVVTAVPAGDFDAIPLLEERSVVVTRSSNPRNLDTPGQVIAARFAAYRSEDPLLQQFLADHFPGLRARKIRPSFTVNDHTCIKDVLMQGDFYAIMPLHSIQGHLESGALRLASVCEVRSSILLIRPASQRETRIQKEFARHLRS